MKCEQDTQFDEYYPYPEDYFLEEDDDQVDHAL